MSRSRTPRRQLAAAVVTVLAITAGGAVTATPATAAIQAPQAPQTAQADVTLPKNSQVVSAGVTGYLTSSGTPTGSEYRWTNYEDGSTRVLKEPQTAYLGNGSDTVFSRKEGQSTYWVNDMAQPSSMLTGISTPGTHYVRGVAGSSLVASTTENGVLDIILLRKSGTSTDTIFVKGIPTDARLGKVSATHPGTVLLHYATGPYGDSRNFVAAVDTFTGEVLETLPANARPIADASLSATHWSWVEYVSPDRVRLATAPRGSGGTPTYTDLGYLPDGGGGMHTGLVGGWVTSSRPYGFTANSPSVLYPLTARPLAGGPAIKLLEHVTTVADAPDGSLVVRGGTIEHGEGVYRIAPGADGTPAATLLAGTDAPTEVTLTGTDVPAVVDLDQNDGKATFTWSLSRPNVSGTVTLRHTRTGKTEQFPFSGQGGTVFTTSKVTVNWSGRLVGVSAYNGAYTWEFRAKPLNGIGPELRKTGNFTVVRKPAGHDYTDNGTPDLLLRDSAGRLWRDDLVKGDMSDYIHSLQPQLLGAGWNAYNQIEAVGNVAGASAGDVVARDASGVLWAYLGKGDGTFATRLKVSAGWNAYNKITGGSDVTGDGWADLFATDTSGVLWMYKGTGSWKAPYSGRTRVGGGWGAFNQITAVGDLTGAPHGDLVARDTAGVLWLYPSTGGATFASRVRLGGGWGGFTHLVGTGDADRDGRNDLLAYAPSGTYVYVGTGNPAAPLTRTVTDLYRPGTTPYNLIG
ncbi:VCBS repeat-containing protein [Streptomyces sp. NBC_00094]|uniref:FG-GAP repeat domain-containing protein n=1 Tax=Streptomyces sp. NBC_00094 TaxID=2903620 RepID=UPI0022555F50|nr:VCBS repeat-containing protein [Streptomyces sp. NBC_00094]MCX5392446.1 VCBS repeat-containing protein [Streptomyces sp. NBC_00094]